MYCYQKWYTTFSAQSLIKYCPTGPTTRQAHRVLQRQDNPPLQWPRHLHQVLGTCLHPSWSHNPGSQRGRPQHVRGTGLSHRMGVLSPRSPEQGQSRQHSVGVNHLGGPVSHRSAGDLPNKSRQVLVHVYGAWMILGLQKDPHYTWYLTLEVTR